MKLMMRLCLLVIVIPFFANAQHFSTADLKLLKRYSTGSFSNEGQAKADTHFVKTGLQIQPIWQKRNDGVWLFVQQTDSSVQFQVWHYYIQDDTTLILQFLQFKEAGKAVQLNKDITQQSKLNLYHLLTRHGCEVYLKKDKKGYTGVSAGKDCFAEIKGVEYLSENISITRNNIVKLEIGFDKEDKQVYGAVNGSYTFIKQMKSSK
jgi:CpeT protein